MELTQLVYVSRRVQGLSDAEIDAIVTDSERRNRERDVTGMLLMSGANVMQLLEGDAAVVDALFEKISRDPRHDEVHVLLQKPVSRRMCPQWGMKRFRPRDPHAALDRAALARMIADIQASHDTGLLSVEARVLLNQFREQLPQPLSQTARAG